MGGENNVKHNFIQKTGRLKPRLYKQNPDGAWVEEWAVKIT